MPQPDSSRDHAHDKHRNETDAPFSRQRGPVDPAAPRWFGARLGGHAGHSGPHPKKQPQENPEQDGRTPQDPDGNEELEREKKERPASHRSPTERNEASFSTRSRTDFETRNDFETEDTGEWVATERFTLEEELEDTWPNVPARYLDD